MVRAPDASPALSRSATEGYCMLCTAALPVAMGRLLSGNGSSAIAAWGARLEEAASAPGSGTGCAGIAACAAAYSRAAGALSPASQVSTFSQYISLGMTTEV